MLFRLMVSVLAMILLAGCGLPPKLATTDKPNHLIEKDKVTVSINEQVLELKLADTIDEQAAGLSNLEKVPFDGMYFVFDPPAEQVFWMKDMLFPIDIIWVNNGAVIKIDPSIAPKKAADDNLLTKYFSPGKVDAVIELPAGRASELGLKPDSSVKILRP